MDKNTYETYEYLPTNSTGGETDQFLVVQDDGTFLLNRQIQYVTQVQASKEALAETCAVYGVEQQFFVDVDNSSELIPVTDQYIIPTTDNGLYSNSFLLQPDVNSTEQIENVITERYDQQNSQDINIVPVTYNSKQGNDFTEITLSDEQYQRLEQKGWILIEFNDKVFVLNSLGLHDITSNQKLMQKLKDELQNEANVKSEIETNEENVTNVAPVQADRLSPVEFMIDVHDSPQLGKVNVINDTETTQTPCKIEDNTKTYKLPIDQNILKNNSLKETSSIKIKTNYVFKDMPDKIYLGKTINGKRLVAKVKKLKNNINKVTTAPPEQYLYSSSTTALHETGFIGVIQDTLAAGINKPSEEDLASAHNVVTQLLKVAAIKSTLLGKPVLITKIKNQTDAFGKQYKNSKPTLVTGRIVTRDGTSMFEHVPLLLQDIRASSEKAQSQNARINAVDESMLKYFLIHQVHSVETRSDADNIVRVSVTLDKRQLPIDFVFDFKRRQPSMVFACSACAALFQNEEALKDHQESHCMESEDNLTIDTETVTDQQEPIKIIKSGTDKLYECVQCHVQYNKLSNCQRHIKIHEVQTVTNSDPSEKQNEDPKKSASSRYKCQMCPSIYVHSSSLAKHIVKKHIKVTTST